MRSGACKDELAESTQEKQEAVRKIVAPLFALAARLLVVGGRLVFLFPSFVPCRYNQRQAGAASASASASAGGVGGVGLDVGGVGVGDVGMGVSVALPEHPCLRFVSSGTQTFKHMTRYCIAFEKIAEV